MAYAQKRTSLTDKIYRKLELDSIYLHITSPPPSAHRLFDPCGVGHTMLHSPGGQQWQKRQQLVGLPLPHKSTRTGRAINHRPPCRPSTHASTHVSTHVCFVRFNSFVQSRVHILKPEPANIKPMRYVRMITCAFRSVW